MRQKQSYSWIFRSMALLLVEAQIVLSLPLPAAAQTVKEEPKEQETKREPVTEVKPAVKVNRTMPKVAPVPTAPLFSAEPTELEIFRARVFNEPLVPVGGRPTTEENRALAEALTGFVEGDGNRVGVLEKFLNENPRSVWTASVLANLGKYYDRRGILRKRGGRGRRRGL